MSPIREERPHQDFEIGYRVANVPPYLQKKKNAAFVNRPIKSLKFVDDSVNIDKANMRRLRLLMEGNRPVRELRALRTQELLQHITAAATSKGMKINDQKTGLMCMSAAIGFEPRVTIDMGDQVIAGSKQMKILGVRVDSVRSHIKDIGRKMRSKGWALAKLRKAGLSSERLVRAYKGSIRPLAEYACPAWHPLTTAEQAAFL